MRNAIAPVLLAVLTAPAFLGAQQQERTLLDRIHRPNMELTNPMQAKSFGGGGGLKIQESPMGRSAFGGAKSASLKEFSGTRSFFGIKNPWFGNRVFETKNAALSAAGGLAKLGSAFPVKDAATRGFAASGKSAPMDSEGYKVRPYLVRGKAQGSLDQLSDRIHKEMTIDDIRELLNKPR